MNSFLQWLSTNTIATTILILAIGVLVPSIAALFIVAFIQGREISFWPPKIGKKPDTGNSKTTSKTNEKKALETVSFCNREGFTVPFNTRLENADFVYMMGINLVGLLSHFHSSIISKAQSGCHFKILLLDPEFYDWASMPTSWQGELEHVKYLEHSIHTIQDFLKKTDNIELRFLPFPPPYTMMIIDPDTPKSEIQVELYIYGRSQHDRPHFLLTPNKNAYWYKIFQKEFDLAWKQSRSFENQKA